MTDRTVRPTTTYLNVGHGFAHLVMLLFPTAVLAMEGTWGMGYAHLLPLGFFGYVLFGVGSLPAGWLGDRWNSAWMMAVFLLGTGAATVLTGFAAGPWSLALGLTAIGLFASIYHPIAIAWLVAAGDRPGRTLGINGVYGMIGTSGAALIAGGLAELISWRAAFLVPGALCFLLGVTFVLGLKRGRLAMVRSNYRRPGGAIAAPDARRGLFLMLGAIVFTGMIFQLAAIGMPKIFQARLGETIGSGALAAGTLVSLVYALAAVGQVIGGLLADRYDQRRLYPLGYGAQVVVLALALATTSPALVLVVLIAVTLQTGSQPIENVLMARYTPDHWRATVYGLKFVLALGLSALAVPLIAAIVGMTGSVDGIFLAMILCALVALGVGFALPATRAAAPATSPATPVADVTPAE